MYSYYVSLSHWNPSGF